MKDGVMTHLAGRGLHGIDMTVLLDESKTHYLCAACGHSFGPVPATVEVTKNGRTGYVCPECLKHPDVMRPWLGDDAPLVAGAAASVIPEDVAT